MRIRPPTARQVPQGRSEWSRGIKAPLRACGERQRRQMPSLGTGNPTARPARS